MGVLTGVEVYVQTRNPGSKSQPNPEGTQKKNAHWWNFPNSSPDQQHQIPPPRVPGKGSLEVSLEGEAEPDPTTFSVPDEPGPHTPGEGQDRSPRKLVLEEHAKRRKQVDLGTGSSFPRLWLDNATFRSRWRSLHKERWMREGGGQEQLPLGYQSIKSCPPEEANGFHIPLGREEKVRRIENIQLYFV